MALSIAFGLVLYGQAPITAPAGYRMPTDKDYSGDWQPYRVKAAKPFTIQADFNGDGLSDEAWLLPSTSPTGWGMFAFLSLPNGQRQAILLDSSVKEPVQRMGITTVAPGKHQTMCGSGYTRCSPGDTGVLTLKLPAISLFVFESANSVFWWDAQAGRFQRTFISD
jgi:hypothetical protein